MRYADQEMNMKVIILSNEHYLSSRETKAWNNHDTRLFYSYPK